MNRLCYSLAVLLALLSPGFSSGFCQTEITEDAFRRAARNGDLETVKNAIESGIDVDAKSAYGATALFFACDREQEEVVNYLLEKGADPNAKDTFYNATPVSWSTMNENQNITLSLVKYGGEFEFGPSSLISLAADTKISSANWPGFRGTGSRGVAQGQKPPIHFHVAMRNIEKNSSGVDKSTDSESEKANKEDSEANADIESKKDEAPAESEMLLWQTPVEGLGLSSPTIWDDKIFLTTAVTEGDAGELRTGLFGDVDSVEETQEFEFKLLCYSKSSGKKLWERTAHTALPAVKRHSKSLHANPTVATDGDHVVAFFGSEGLYCYTPNGDLVWKRNLGYLDSGWFFDKDYQWGFASSPTIHAGKLFVQVDIQTGSFLACIDLKTGNEIWRTERDEIPSWSTPLVHKFEESTMVITNGTKSSRGYDAATGEVIWSMKGNSEIVVPTPNVAHDLIFVSSGYSPIRPVYAIKPDATGDISLESDQNANDGVEWSIKNAGPYMPTPIVYGDYLYCCANAGILTCFEAKTGKKVYKKRLRSKGGQLAFTASPVAADGHVYLTAEDGRVLVVKAGPEFEVVTTNELNQNVLATPAISEGAMFFRTQTSLIAVGQRITD